jgi:hypothetical protein
MKKPGIFILVYFLLHTATAQIAQDTSYWKKNGDVTLTFSQVSFSNWAAGGKNSVSGVGLFNYSANFLKERTSWDNSLNLGYGLLKEGDHSMIKSEDKLELNSKAGYKMGEVSHWFYSALFNLRSQFADGYKYPDTENLISTFFAPAYLSLALGADYKPSDMFSLFLSPLGSKFTIVADDFLSGTGAYGVDPGKKFRAELGGTIKSELKFPVAANVDVVTGILLFSNYIDNPQNIDVNWDFRLNMKINDYLSANFIANMMYDHNVLVSVDRNNDGIFEGKGRRIQMKQLFGAGFSYKF